MGASAADAGGRRSRGRTRALNRLCPWTVVPAARLLGFTVPVTLAGLVVVGAAASAAPPGLVRVTQASRDRACPAPPLTSTGPTPRPVCACCSTWTREACPLVDLFIFFWTDGGHSSHR